MLQLKHPPHSAEGMASELGLRQDGTLLVCVAITCAQKQQTDKTASWEPEERREHLGKQNISYILAASMLSTTCI